MTLIEKHALRYERAKLASMTAELQNHSRLNEPLVGYKPQEPHTTALPRTGQPPKGVKEVMTGYSRRSEPVEDEWKFEWE